MNTRSVLGRFFGWEVRRGELVGATVVAALVCASAVLLSRGPLGLMFALLTGIATGLLVYGGVGAARGREPDAWLAYTGLGYLLMGVFGVVNVTSIAALSLSGFSPALLVAFVTAIALGSFFLGRGLWFVTATL